MSKRALNVTARARHLPCGPAGTEPSRAALPAAEIGGRRRGAEPTTASGRPSINPHLGDRRLVLRQKGAQLDRRLSLDGALEAQTPPSGCGIGLRHDVADLRFFCGYDRFDRLGI